MIKATGISTYIKSFLEDQKERGLYRKFETYDTSCLDFSSNDYLGLSHNKASLTAGFRAAKIYGSGSTGSRLLSGNKEIFAAYEHQIALDKGFEAALIFNSGFVANASVIAALSLPHTVLIFDKLNHASLYYGVDLSKVKLMRYKHLDYNELEDILKKCGSYKNKILISETIFGMDGDSADIQVLSSLSQKYGALLYLDEAHATGLYGQNGYGLTTDFVLDPSTTIVMGTFSKALASFGAYIACSQLIKEYLIQKSKGLIYSTALAPFCIGVSMHNWTYLKKLAKTRQHIMELSDTLRKKISQLRYPIIGGNTNIIPIAFEDIKDMTDVHNKLLKNGIKSSFIRRPTSPSPRIRFAINATHTAENVESVLDILQ
ncbi:MAG: aminotransferase class I/II-fold pyridoxal phosphate-dependent enzyme [Holosporales bacterium]|nr:aminotransferase class I/II-fold pyridoxal phosphate-dependent enzyme [Holosporales bacterium]